MEIVEITLQVCVVVFALIAAFFWFRSGAIEIPDTMQMNLSGDGSPSGYMKKQGKLSAIAAIFAALSAICQAVHLTLGLII